MERDEDETEGNFVWRDLKESELNVESRIGEARDSMHPGFARCYPSTVVYHNNIAVAGDIPP